MRTGICLSVFSWLATLSLAQSVVCTPAVPSDTCKMYSVGLKWPPTVATSNLEIVIADQKSFELEKNRITD